MPNPLFDAIVAGRQAGQGTLLHCQDGESRSDDDLLQLTAQLANTLVGSGVKPGDRVAAQVEKSPEALALYLACLKVGGVFLPLNRAYTERELAYFIGDAEPRLYVCDPCVETQAGNLVSGTECQFLTLSANAEGTLLAAARHASARHDTCSREPEDLAAILYTSGTTGRSKGAMLTQGNLLSNAESLIDSWRFTADDVLLHGLPIFHTHGLFVACNVSLIAGGAMIFLPRFDADEFIARLPQATTMMGVPTFYTRLLAHPGFTRELVSHMRLFTSGSAPMLADTHREFEARTGQRILERYGMTETNMSTSNPYDGERIVGTVGLPLPGVEVKICAADTGDELGAGETGVLHVRGANVFRGYWRMPEKTREELHDDGWFITGDLASIDERGYVTIVGRDKDLIISGGYNVYPKEVEQFIDELPGVLESAVVGAPHPDFGEAVVALVVPDAVSGSAAEGADSSRTGSAKAPDEKNVLDSLQGSLARYKQPKRILFIDELPRNAMGKVQKKALRDQVSTLFAE